MGVVWGGGAEAEAHWNGRAHGVWLARVHGVPMARVHGVLEERMNSSGSVGKNQGEVKFEGWKVGEDGKGVDLLAKHQIHGSNPTKSHQTNKSQKKLGLFLVGFSDLGQEQQNQARKQRGGLPFHEKPWLMIPYDVGWNPIEKIFHELEVESPRTR